MEGALSSQEDSPLLNRVVQGLYPPGSTIKPMIADAALTDGVTNTSEIFECDGILDVGGGHTIRESHGEVHGRVDLRQAVTESCNITFGTLGMRMGDEKLKNAFSRFGFDREIGDEILMTKSHFPDFGKLSKGVAGPRADHRPERLARHADAHGPARRRLCQWR